MTGYSPPRRRVRLKFEAHPGLEIVARSVPLRTFLKITTLAETAGLELAPGSSPELSSEVVEALSGTNEIFGMFASALVEWNLLDEEGDPVPCTLDGLLDQDTPFAVELLQEWMTAIGGVPGPLSNRSAAGGPSPVASVPMVVSSPSQAS